MCEDTRLRHSTMPAYKLISWGANSHGQLGQGVLSEQCVLPREVDLSECGLRPESVKKIVGGGGHTLILDAEGGVYSCGWNNKGQAGISDPGVMKVPTFRRLSFDDRTIVDVCCGWDSSAALTKDGDLYLWGSNRYGQLGDDPSRLSTSSPICSIRSGKVKRVSMGLRHTAAVTDSGYVLVCGANSKGQLGLTNAENKLSRDARHYFTAIPGLRNIEDVACGEHHTVVATLHGGAYTTYFFGDNKHGQAGLDPRECPRICPAHRSVHCDSRLGAPIHIHAGWSHTNILNDGAVYSWGRNSYGQLGRGRLEEVGCDFWRMQRVENVPRIMQLSVGSEHNVALAEDGTIFCWGWNEHGNCGNGNTKDVLLPKRLPLSHNSIGVLVGSGAGHSFAVIKDIN